VHFETIVREVAEGIFVKFLFFGGEQSAIAAWMISSLCV
jgi:hypothetical protein